MTLPKPEDYDTAADTATAMKHALLGYKHSMTPPRMTDTVYGGIHHYWHTGTPGTDRMSPTMPPGMGVLPGRVPEYYDPSPPWMTDPSSYTLTISSSTTESELVPMSKKKSGTPTPDEVWAMVSQVAPHTRTVLLYGPPGTGKSYIARSAGVAGHKVHPIVVHADLPAAELRGHFIPTQKYDNDGMPIGNPILEWRDGPAVAAWRDGGRLVLDEIDKAGDDALSFLLGVLDNEATAKMELGTTGEILSPHKDLTIWATMNGEPDDLPAALKDRFPVTVAIKSPHPDAVATLPKDLQHAAIQLSVSPDPERQVGLRCFMEFAHLRDRIGVEAAAYLIFQERWPYVKEAIEMANIADQR